MNLDKEYPIRQMFGAKVRPLVSKEKDEYLSLASLIDIKEFLPEIDAESNPDVLPIAFNACVVNRVNRNDDVIDTDTAISLAKNFVNKQINLEHKRDRVVGVILKAGYSSFGTDEPMTEEEVKKSDGPFNITLGGVLWRVVNSRLTDLVEEVSDPSSENYELVSASWELGFQDYHLVLLEGSEKNIAKGTVISEVSEVEALSENLRSSGGSGEINGKKIYRKPVGKVASLGIGLTENPAAEVKGIATALTKVTQVETESTKAETEEVASSEAEGVAKDFEPHWMYNPKTGEKEWAKVEADHIRLAKMGWGHEPIQDINSKEIEAGQPQIEKNSVLKDKTMKLDSVKQITDENLKELNASQVSKLIEEDIAKESEKFVAEKQELNSDLEAAKAETAILATKQTELTDTVATLEKELAEMKEAETARAAQELFNSQMDSLDATFELSDDERGILAKRLSGVDAEGFTALEAELKVLMSEKVKGLKTEAEKTEKAPELEIKASEEAEKVIEDASKSAELDKETVANTSSTEEKSLKDRYSAAFGGDAFNITV
tara:strand:- start:1715 stop:3361 length:1647 start_codon:yes stop_codon:yes gene_type:complete